MISDVFDRVTNPYGYNQDIMDGVWGPCNYCLNTVPNGSYVGMITGADVGFGIGDIRASIITNLIFSQAATAFRHSDPTVYAEQVIEHLQRETDILREEIDGLDDRQVARRFGVGTESLIDFQLIVMQKSLTISRNAGYAEDFALFIIEQGTPAPKPLKTWKRILGWLGFDPQYDVSGWSANCVDLQCGFTDPNGGFHPIREVAPPILRRQVQGL